MASYADQWVCGACGATELKPKRQMRGSAVLEWFLWSWGFPSWALLLFVPPMIAWLLFVSFIAADALWLSYVIYRRTGPLRLCRTCGHAEMVPVCTPAGFELMSRFRSA